MGDVDRLTQLPTPFLVAHLVVGGKHNNYDGDNDGNDDACDSQSNNVDGDDIAVVIT